MGFLIVEFNERQRFNVTYFSFYDNIIYMPRKVQGSRLSLSQGIKKVASMSWRRKKGPTKEERIAPPFI